MKKLPEREVLPPLSELSEPHGNGVLPADGLRDQMMAKREQLTAAFQENAGVIQQMERELESRRAAQHQLFGSIKTLDEILGPAEAAGG